MLSAISHIVGNPGEEGSHLGREQRILSGVQHAKGEEHLVAWKEISPWNSGKGQRMGHRCGCYSKYVKLGAQAWARLLKESMRCE